MIRTALRSFLYAQAIIGIVLTLGFAFGATDVDTLTAPLFSVGGLLILYALISSSIVRFPNRLEGLVAVENATQRLAQQKRAKRSPSKVSTFFTQNRPSIQWIVTGVFVLVSAWLLLSFGS